VKDAFAHKRRLLVEALAACADVSTRANGINIDTLRSLFTGGMREWWREGELKLEPAWKILCAQEGMTPLTVAPPLLLLRSFESKLDVRVRLPDALSAIPESEQQRLLDTIDAETRSTVGAAIDKAKVDADQAAKADELAADKAASRPAGASAEQRKTASHRAAAPASTIAPPVDSRAKAEAAKLRNRKIAFTLLPVSFLAVGLALFLSLRPTASDFDVAQHEAVLKLQSGRRDGKSLTAVVVDPRWKSGSKDVREKLARALFEAVIANGIQMVTLLDENERVRAVAYLADGKIFVVMR
jgi:hypothetical protein